MTSELKSATARINGAKSRGPKTPEGLQKSSRNALKRGFTSRSNILLDRENPEEFQSTLDGYLAIYQPTNPFEKDLVEEIVATRWRIRRLWAVETSLLNGEILNQESKIGKSDSDLHLGQAFRALADGSRSLDLTLRYESRLRRIHDRACKTLHELQQARPSIPQNLPNEPTTASGTFEKLPNEPTGATTKGVSKTLITENPTPSLFSSEPAPQIPLPFLNPAWRQGRVFE